MDQDPARNDSRPALFNVDSWRDHSDNETDELGLRIAEHARKVNAEESVKPENQRFIRPRTPPSDDEEGRYLAVLRRLNAEGASKPEDQQAREHQASLKEGREKPLRERLERQPDGNRPREPFWRAKERRAERNTAEVENRDAIRPKQHVRAVSDGHPPADPPVTVPQGWGHRNRHRATWLNRSTTEGEGLGLVDSVKRVDEDTVLLHKTSFTGDDILASGENTPLSARRIRQLSSPSSLHHMNTTLQSGAPDADDVDFNDASVLNSTPAVNTRNRKIDELMKEEGADADLNVERQSTTTQRRSRFALGGSRGSRPLSAPAGDNKPLTRRRRSVKEKEEPTIDEKDEEPMAGPPVAVDDDDLQANGRNESIDLLRRLARVSSLSPSPAPDKVVRDYPNERRKSKDAQGLAEEDKWDASDIPTVRQRGRDRKTPAASVFTNGVARTDTKADEKARGPVSKLAERDPRRINSEPLQPKSALEAIMQEAKSKKDSNIGDSTLASLEDIMNPNLDNSIVQPEAGKPATVEGTHEAEDALPPAEQIRRREEREFEDANRRLRVARTSIKDADRGLRRLENQLESAESEPAKVIPVIKETIKTPNAGDVQVRYPNHPPGFKPYTDHNGRTRCRHCGGCYASVWRGLWVEFRELFYTWGPEEAGAPLQMTWLGTMVAVWWAWMISEVIVSKLFDQWLYGAKFPFVTITLFYRLVREPVETGKWIADVVGNLIFGDSSTVAEPLSTTSAWVRSAAPERIHERAARGNDGDWVAAAAAATGATTRRVVKSAMEAVDEAGSMWDDEYLNL